MKEVTAYNESQIRNDADLSPNQPFSARVRLQGVQDILFHRWSNRMYRQKQKRKRAVKKRNATIPKPTFTATMKASSAYPDGT